MLYSGRIVIVHDQECFHERPDDDVRRSLTHPGVSGIAANADVHLPDHGAQHRVAQVGAIAREASVVEALRPVEGALGAPSVSRVVVERERLRAAVARGIVLITVDRGDGVAEAVLVGAGAAVAAAEEVEDAVQVLVDDDAEIGGIRDAALAEADPIRRAGDPLAVVRPR